MATVKDIELDEDVDLVIENGDFSVSESDQQHIILIINTFPGHWKQFPTCGTGIIQYLASSGQGSKLNRSIRVQLEADGFTVNQLTLSERPDGYFDYDLSAERI
jgi:hypothetical protein